MLFAAYLVAEVVGEFWETPAALAVRAIARWFCGGSLALRIALAAGAIDSFKLSRCS
jgi:hypothetical protein